MGLGISSILCSVKLYGFKEIGVLYLKYICYLHKTNNIVFTIIFKQAELHVCCTNVDKLGKLGKLFILQLSPPDSSLHQLQNK